MARFRFRFAAAYRVAAAPFGVTPRTTMVEVADGSLHVRFGPWALTTPVDNVAGCEPSGPFSFPKTAGPAHLSLADRGLTCATNGDEGLCIRFAEPVPGIDPWGVIRHPGVTVTVERTDDLRRMLDPDTSPEERQRIEEGSDGVAAEPPQVHLARWVRWPGAIAVATWQYVAAFTHVSRHHSVSDGPPPRLEEPADGDEVQPIDSGTGPLVQRTYRAHIAGTTVSPEELTERLARNLDRTSSSGVSEFVEQKTTDEAAGEGSEYRIRMPGPWDPAVRVVERTPTAIRFATLEGHMEAGQVELRAGRHDDGRLVFEVHSVARSGGPGFSVLYDRLKLAREMQLNMWMDFCTNVCSLAGGRLDGKLELVTTEHRV